MHPKNSSACAAVIMFLILGYISSLYFDNLAWILTGIFFSWFGTRFGFQEGMKYTIKTLAAIGEKNDQ